MWETCVWFPGWGDLWRREGLPTPVFWPGEFQGLYWIHGHDWATISFTFRDVWIIRSRSFFPGRLFVSEPQKQQRFLTNSPSVYFRAQYVFLPPPVLFAPIDNHFQGFLLKINSMLGTAAYLTLKIVFLEIMMGSSYEKRTFNIGFFKIYYQISLHKAS